jgi:hypothetical protein
LRFMTLVWWASTKGHTRGISPRSFGIRVYCGTLWKAKIARLHLASRQPVVLFRKKTNGQRRSAKD